MLSREDNELLCRVGRGTEMGDLLRQYWLPFLPSMELPERDGPPKKVRLLGEDLVAFRDTRGDVGLMAANCPHRGVSLFFGRNEECGIRCVYHGWKFDVDGNCVDMPNEPPEFNFKDKVKARAYPVVERGGLIWTYMGPRKTPPPMPDLEANMMPGAHVDILVNMQDSNWLQVMEGSMDDGHAGFLHDGSMRWEDRTPGTFQYYDLKDRTPRSYVIDTPGGVTYGARRD